MRLRTKIEIVSACVAVPCVLELFSAKRSFAWLGRVAAGGESVAPALLAFNVDRILHRAPWIWRHSCLRRSAVLAFLLKRGGHDASVVIGVRRSAVGVLEAHAWLACDGNEPFLEPSNSIATFQPLGRA